MPAQSPSMRVPQIFFLGVLAVWVYFVISKYFESHYVPLSQLNGYFSVDTPGFVLKTGNLFVLLKKACSLLLAGIVFLAAFGLGNRVIKLVKLAELNDSERNIFSISFGLGILILAIFLSGISGLLYKAPILAVFWGLGAWGLFDVYRQKLIQRLPASFLGLSLFEKLFFLAAVLSAVVTLAGSISPEIFYDSLVYHLAKPNFWIQNHAIRPNEARTVTDFYPGNMNILYAVGLFFKDETVCKCIHFVFSLLTSCMIYLMGKTYFYNTLLNIVMIKLLIGY